MKKEKKERNLTSDRMADSILWRTSHKKASRSYIKHIFFITLLVYRKKRKSPRSKQNVLGWIIISQNVHILIQGICEYIMLYGKWNLVDVIKLRVLRWGYCSGLSRWAPCNHKGPHKGEARGPKSIKGLES